VRLLVVEDERRMAAALAKGFTHAGFSVDVAHDGHSALAQARETAYDAVLLDLMLPGMSGYEVIRRLRASEIWTPILVLAHVRALLRRGATGPRPVVLTVGDVRLDPSGHTVEKSGEPVELTTQEFAMLEYLMRRPGRVVSKAELLEHVWRSPGTDANAVEVYASYLRRKLGRESIETVRGVGYRLPSS